LIEPHRYRPDIDGLRGVAVLVVVARHIGVPGMSGGFTGVDVFFAISGYLITGLLVRERMASGRIDIAAFYARRVRRLLPALGTVMAATLLLGCVALLPDEQVALAKSALASLVFAANVYFWKLGQGYFADPSGLLPLLHLWTLAVEEQFYLLWPLALLLLVRLAALAKMDVERTIAIALAAAALVSLTASVVVGSRAPAAAFLLLPARAWEIAAGGLLALAPAVPAAWARPLAPLGLSAIVMATVMFDATTPLPAVCALLPVVGAIAVIAGGGAAPGGVVSRALAAWPLALLGTVSYGWYLWHWPLLAIVRNVSGLEPALPRDAALAAVALVLAVVMWRWLESPVRAGQVPMFRTTWGSLGGGVAILVACGLSSGALWAWGRRQQPAASILAQYASSRGSAARDFPFCDGPLVARCEAGAATGARTILLWGDSHAAHLTGGLDRAARGAALRVMARTKGGCSPGGFPDSAPGKDEALWADCATFNQGVVGSLPALQRDHGLRGVMVAGDWLDRRAGWDRQLEADIDEIRRHGLRVVLVGAIPVFPADFIACAVRRGADACALPRADVARQESGVDAALRRIAAGRPDVQIWSPLDALCPQRRCPSVMDQRLLYRGRNHLTIDGSARLAPAMAPTVAWLAGATPAR
jgi:peptidoglycan/LPS O-acetylase OafA/YrhL